jgi:hypothetical protein
MYHLYYQSKRPPFTAHTVVWIADKNADNSPSQIHIVGVCNGGTLCLLSYECYFLASSQNVEKRLLDSSYISVRLSAWNNSAPTGWIFMGNFQGVVANMAAGTATHPRRRR